MIRALIFCITVLPCANAHSWAECTQYNPSSFDYTTLGNFDRSRCMGYPRAFARQFAAGFGVDTGYNWEHPECRDSYNANDYTNEIPMATYAPGQTIYISHPAKNHVAELPCTNAFIPDTSMELFMSTQPGVDTYDYSLPLIGGAHVDGQIDHLGFQRCYKFCDDMDKSHCLTGWTLPENIVEGRHSFLWKWQFNLDQYYSNCFDAYITSNGSTMPGSNAGSNTPSTTAPNDTITFPPATTGTPSSTTAAPTSTPKSTTSMPTSAPTTPAPTEDFSIQPQTPATTAPTSMPTAAPTTPAPTAMPEVITSAASSLISPLSYIMNITGFLNITGLLNITIL